MFWNKYKRKTLARRYARKGEWNRALRYRKIAFRTRRSLYYGGRPASYRGYAHPSIQQELKFHDSVNTNTAVATTGIIKDSIVLIGQGVTESTRLGRKIIVRSIAARWIINLALVQNVADITPTGDQIRIMVFIDHQCNGANAAVTDILETASIESYRNLANIARFDVLYDKVHNIQRMFGTVDGTNTASGGKKENKMFKMFKKLDLPIEYNSTAGAITEITSNNIAFLYITHGNAISIDAQQTRVRFDG